MRLAILAICLIVVSCERVSVTPFALEPCHLDGLAEEVRCGIHDVAENPAAPAGRRLQIHVAVLPALRRLVDADPLFIFAGGPGQGARSYSSAVARFFKKVRRSRDIVLIDLRGTGASAPLRCPADDDSLSLTPEDIKTLVRECRDALTADPRYYTHQESLADVDEIRRRMGYKTINLWGGSWGTRAALLYALRYPEATRAVVLDGAVPIDLGFPRTASADANAALNRLVADCAAAADCKAAFPNPAALLGRLADRFSAGPVTTTLKHPRSGAPTNVAMQYDMVTEIVRGALYVPRDSAALLFTIEQAAHGDFAPLAAQYLRTASWSTNDMTLGATYSILCSEDLPRTTAIDFAAAAKGSFFGTVYADAWRARCADWPPGRPLDAGEAATSTAAALILSGEHDPVTPPRTGAAMGRHFPANWQVVVPGAAHNASFSGCVPDLIAEFIARGTGDGLDVSCVNRVAWPPFAVSTAGSRP
jgi:pimeloyl-ACP methyl ester carboxylesterase